MKHSFVLSVSSVSAAALLGLAQVGFAAGICASQFNGQLPAEMSYRQAYTLLSTTGEISATSPAREKEMGKVISDMTDEVTGKGKYVGKQDTPPIEFFVQDGVNFKYLGHSTGDNNQETKIQVSNVGPSGELKGSLLAPVSGHTHNMTDINQWKTSDTFDIHVDYSTDAKGETWPNGTEKPLLTAIKSQDYVTVQEMTIPLKKGVVTRILYYRSGSGGPSGYWDGRIIEFEWDGS